MQKTLLLLFFSFLTATMHGQLKDVSVLAGDYQVIHDEGDYVYLIREHRDAGGTFIKRSLQRTGDFVTFEMVDDYISYRGSNSLFFQINDILYLLDEKNHLYGITPNKDLFLVDSTIAYRPYLYRTPFYFLADNHVLLNLHNNGVLFFDGHNIKHFEFNFPFRVADSCMYGWNSERNKIVRINLFTDDVDTLPLLMSDYFQGAVYPDRGFNVNGLFLFWLSDSVNNERYLRAVVTDGHSVFADTVFYNNGPDDLSGRFVPLPSSSVPLGESVNYLIKPRPKTTQTCALDISISGAQINPNRLEPTLLRHINYDVNLHTFSQVGPPSLTRHRATYFMIGETKHGTLAFSDIDSSGIEPVVLKAGEVEKLMDIGDGMHGLAQKQANSSDNRILRYGRTRMPINRTSIQINDGSFVFLGNSTTQGLSLFISDGSKEGTGFLAKFPHFWNFNLRQTNPTLFANDGKLFIVLETTIDNTSKTFTYQYTGDFTPISTPPTDGNIWTRAIEGITSFSGGGAYSKPYIQKRDNRILLVSSMSKHDYAFFPEVKQTLFQNDWASRLYYAIYDTAGNLLEKSLVVAWRGLVSLTNNNSKVLVFPENHSVPTGPHFDTRQPVSLPQTVVAQYSSSNQLEWELKFERVFDVNILDIKTDEEGNTYLLGYYSNGNMRVDGFELNSDYTFQYFTTKISAEGKLIWAKNISIEGLSNVSFFNHLEISEGHVLIGLSEGTPSTSATCQFRDYTIRIVKIRKSNGSVVFTKDIQFTDLALAHSITEGANGDIWISGWFRGELVENDRIVANATGSGNCPRSGFLIGLNTSNGKIFATEVTDVEANYSAVTYTNGKIWNVLSEHGTTRIQKRNHQGYMEKEYAFPTRSIHWLSDEFRFIVAQIIPLNNESDDFLYFSGSVDPRALSFTDTLFYQNFNNNMLSEVLMKRSGILLKDKLNHENVFNFLPDVQNIVLFPNPVSHSSNKLFLRALNAKFRYSTYEIFDYQGGFLQAGEFSSDEIPLHEITLNSQYARGVYSIVLEGEDGVLVLKFIIN
ncbi:MAG: hypothetical protein JJU02_10670 [Cryomorphaceae bacterium]|nr:hypothetical protein [Cryomorphaceae bacterium]